MTTEQEAPPDPLRSLEISKLKEQRTYGSFVAYAFTVNYILGIGLLSIPFAFSKAGLLFSSALMWVATFFSAVSLVCVMEASERAKALTGAAVLRHSDPIRHDHVIEADPLLATPGSTSLNSLGPLASSKKFEINQLCGIFLGRWCQKFYEIGLLLYMYGALWGYSAVFCSSLVQQFPLTFISDQLYCLIDGQGGWHCLYSFIIYAMLFSIFVVPLTCLDLTEQKIIQVTLCIFRFTVLTVMILTVTVALFSNPYVPTTPKNGAAFIAYKEYFEYSGLGKIFSTAVFAQLVHHSIPGLMQPIKNKSQSRTIFMATFATTATFYTFLGLMCAMYFGDQVKSVVTLNWQYYVWNKSPVKWYGSFVTYLVVLFPVIDVVSAYPLSAITLGNNLFFGLPERFTNSGKNVRVKIACRLIASIPPILGSIIVHDLPVIIGWTTGIFGFFIAFIIPAALQYFSKKKAESKLQSFTTMYSWHFSHDFYTFTIGIFGFLALIFTIIELTFGKQLGFAS